MAAAAAVASTTSSAAAPPQLRPRANTISHVDGAAMQNLMSAAHSAADIDRAVAAFGEVGRELGVIG